MRELIDRYAERIDAASLRERVFMFAAGALVVIYVASVALIQPLRDRQRQLGAEIAQKEKELRAVQLGLQRIVRERQRDPDTANRERIAQLRGELQALDSRVAEEQRRFTPPERMRAVLEEMLQRDRRLRLVDLKTLPVTVFADSPEQKGRKVYRHGVELTLAGGYLDFYRYLRALEALPTQLYWGRAELAVATYPAATLKLTVYTLSFDQAWLVV
ncbi:MAG: type II secretion system protein GspM [Steroidobacteraceae bacterium]